MTKRKETGVMQRHATACPRNAGGRGYAPHRCAGKWYYVLEIGRDSKGKRLQEMKGGFRSQREASEARAARRLQLRSRPTDAYRVTVGQYLEDWLAGKRRLRQTTRESYREYIDTLFVPQLGSLRLAELESRPQHLEEFFTWLSEAPNRHGHQRSAATVRRVYAVLRAALNSAVRRRMLTFNPLLAVELPEARRAKVTTWTAEQAVAFLIFLEGDEQEGRQPERLRALYHLELASSMRRGELLGQRWDTDLKTDQAVTHVAEQLVKTRHGGVVVGAPKTRAGVRPLWFDEYTAQVLAEHRQRQEAERAAWGEAWVDTGLVFTREDGSPLNPDHVSRRFRTLAKRAGVPVIRFHDLRHTSISLGLERGVDIKVMSERVGHSSSWFTADTYAHVGNAQAREAGERIGSVISLAAIRAARDAANVAAEIEETDVSKM